jgi:hypothetical protein
MTYIHAVGIHNTVPQTLPDLKSELKALSGKVYRRIDHFIQLAIIGAHKTAAGRQLSGETALYMTSGQGNVAVFQRVREQRHIHKMLPKPVDFINLLSNSAGFYVASHLGLRGKNLFLNHHRFPVQMTLLAAWNDLNLGKQEAVLVGGIDEWIERQELAKKLLGVSEATQLGEGSNWMLLSSDREGAMARFELEPKSLERSALEARIGTLEAGSRIAFSSRFTAEEIADIMALNPECERYEYEATCGYYETLPLYAMNRFLTETEGMLLHVDVSDGRYMLMSVDNREYLPKGAK